MHPKPFSNVKAWVVWRQVAWVLLVWMLVWDQEPPDIPPSAGLRF